MPQGAADVIAPVLEEHLADAEDTIAPAGFVHWAQDKHPELFETCGAEELLAYVSQYFAVPLRTHSDAPPLRPDVARDARRRDRNED